MPVGEFFTLQEICVLLNLLPNTFRQIVREFPDLIELEEEVRKGHAVLGLTRGRFEVFRAIVELRGQGHSPEEIRGRVAAMVEANAAGFAEDGMAAPAGEPGGDGDSPPPDFEIIWDPGDEREGPLAVPEERAGSESPLGDPSVEAAATVDVASANRLATEKQLAAEIAALKDELLKMDQRRRDERDKLLTTLMRTQHELQSLRYEVGLSLTRRGRKRRRGFWNWLFD